MSSAWFYLIPIVIIVMLVVCVLCARMCMRQMGTGGCCCARQETPLDALKRRYANGEVSKEQFEALKRDLAA